MADKIKTAEVAKGRWTSILPRLGVPAALLNGRQQPCLLCGGKTRLTYTNWKDDGCFYCTHCGSMNGFKFLMKLHGWTFAEAARNVDELLRTNWRVSMSPSNRPKCAFEDEIPRSVKNCALWLRKFHPDKLEPWLEKHEVEIRWWLEQQPVALEGEKR